MEDEVHLREDMDASNLRDDQLQLIEEALALVSTVHEEAGASQTLRTYLMLGEATKKLEAVLAARDVTRGDP